jgi:hypothetical protein
MHSSLVPRQTEHSLAEQWQRFIGTRQLEHVGVPTDVVGGARASFRDEDGSSDRAAAPAREEDMVIGTTNGLNRYIAAQFRNSIVNGGSHTVVNGGYCEERNTGSECFLCPV